MKLTLGDRLKRLVWRVIVYPIFPTIQKTLVFLQIVKNDRYAAWNNRQPWLLGTIAPGRTFDAFLKFLNEQGFKNHFVAWSDNGQNASLRKLDGFKYQYHLRVFKDGQVRGHYELTPEAHPMKHFHFEGAQERRNEFLVVLGDWIVPAQEEYAPEKQTVTSHHTKAKGLHGFYRFLIGE